MTRDGEQIGLSLSYCLHDSGCALSIGNRIVASIEFERLFRIKRKLASRREMEVGARYLLSRYNIQPSEIDYIVLGLNNPRLALPDIVEDVTYGSMALFERNYETVFVRHQIGHAGFAHFSGFDTALVATADAGGDRNEAIAWFGLKGLSLKRLSDAIRPEHVNGRGYFYLSNLLYE